MSTLPVVGLAVTALTAAAAATRSSTPFARAARSRRSRTPSRLRPGATERTTTTGWAGIPTWPAETLTGGRARPAERGGERRLVGGGRARDAGLPQSTLLEVTRDVRCDRAFLPAHGLEHRVQE